MEGYCSTGQSPQRAVVPVEEEEDSNCVFIGCNKNDEGCTVHVLQNSKLMYFRFLGHF
jgi:hypothetical protein